MAYKERPPGDEVEKVKENKGALRRVLVVRVCALGDLVLTIPWLRALRKKFSVQHLHILCRGEHGEFLKSLEIVERAFPDEGSGWHVLYGGECEPELSRLRPNPVEYDAVFLFSWSPQSPLAGSLKGILREKVWILPARPPEGYKDHAATLPFSCLGMEWTMEEIRELSYLERANIPEDETLKTTNRILTLHPGSGSPRKNFPPKRFARLMEDILHEIPEVHFTIIKGPADVEVVSELTRFIRVPHTVATVSSLLELVRILIQTWAFVGNDSGVTHLASFLGIPVVAIFGPSDQLIWSPLGRRTKVVVAETSCSPCHLISQVSCTGPCKRFPPLRMILSALKECLGE